MAEIDNNTQSEFRELPIRKQINNISHITPE